LSIFRRISRAAAPTPGVRFCFRSSATARRIRGLVSAISGWRCVLGFFWGVFDRKTAFFDRKMVFFDMKMVFFDMKMVFFDKKMVFLI
jgi:hypothetical protein